MSAKNLFNDLLDLAGTSRESVSEADVQGSDPLLATRYRIAETGAASLAAAAAGAAALWTLRGGQPQSVSIDGPAAVAALRSNHYIKFDDASPPRPRDKVTGFYPVADNRWFYLHCNFPNLRDANLKVLGVEADPEAIARKTAEWDGVALETAINEGGGCGSFVRSEAEWNATAQAKAIAREPLLEIIRIGEAPPEPLPAGDRPLSGIRVLDLTRVLAGPTCGRALAEHGADVLKVAKKGMPDSGMFDFDTGLGKLSTFLDLDQTADAETLRELIRQGDVFLQSYRPGSMAGRGFGPEALAKLRPGIVCVTLSAWGFTGPWAGRRGYDTAVQGANGMAFTKEGQKPEFMPVSAQDYIAGYLLALGTMEALRRRATEGGSWLVRTSLAVTGQWVRAQGLVLPDDYAKLGRDLPPEEIGKLLMDSPSPVAKLTHLAPAAKLSVTAGRWARPAVPLGTHEPVWPERTGT